MTHHKLQHISSDIQVHFFLLFFHLHLSVFVHIIHTVSLCISGRDFLMTLSAGYIIFQAVGDK